MPSSRALARRGQWRRGHAVGADRERVRQFAEQRQHNGAGTGAEIDDAPGAGARARAIDHRERLFDQRLGFGRGTSTAGDSARRKPQNSLKPVMRATGSRASRRAVSASIRPRSASSSARSPARTRPRMVET